VRHGKVGNGGYRLHPTSRRSTPRNGGDGRAGRQAVRARAERQPAPPVQTGARLNRPVKVRQTLATDPKATGSVRPIRTRSRSHGSGMAIACPHFTHDGGRGSSRPGPRLSRLVCGRARGAEPGRPARCSAVTEVTVRLSDLLDLEIPRRVRHSRRSQHATVRRHRGRRAAIGCRRNSRGTFDEPDRERPVIADMCAVSLRPMRLPPRRIETPDRVIEVPACPLRTSWLTRL
jgi:hypothetical protein